MPILRSITVACTVQIVLIVVANSVKTGSRSDFARCCSKHDVSFSASRINSLQALKQAVRASIAYKKARTHLSNLPHLATPFSINIPSFPTKPHHPICTTQLASHHTASSLRYHTLPCFLVSSRLARPDFSHLRSHGFHRPAQARHQALLLERPREVALSLPPQNVDVEQRAVQQRQEPEANLAGSCGGRGEGAFGGVEKKWFVRWGSKPTTSPWINCTLRRSGRPKLLSHFAVYRMFVTIRGELAQGNERHSGKPRAMTSATTPTVATTTTVKVTLPVSLLTHHATPKGTENSFPPATRRLPAASWA